MPTAPDPKAVKNTAAVKTTDMPITDPNVDMAQDKNIVIGFEDVAVRYRMPRERLSGIKEYTVRLLQNRLDFEDFWALHGITAYIQRGQIFGVIGRNGSGKSTLLKTIARVLAPTRGRIFTRGRVAPLLELGAGFQPELTGRENVFLNSALLGRTHHETQRLLPGIMDFAEIGEFIDSPLRTYSTGMVARLGFAVATCVRPDILLVDEVLSVGDSLFQQKCLGRMYEFHKQGTTIVIVSHGMATIEAFCQQALWLDKGRQMALGAVSEVIREYSLAVQNTAVVQNKIMKDTATVSYGTGISGIEFPSTQTTDQDENEGPVFDDCVVEAHPGYVGLNQIGGIYPSVGILDVMQGSVAAWVKFRDDGPGLDAAIFHTNDSRYVLYVSPIYSFPLNRQVRRIVARAGGNQRVFDTFYGTADFPEVFAQIGDAPGNVVVNAGEWHLVAMTWLGYPEGRLWLYIDGNLIGEKAYNPGSDRGDPLPDRVAIGMRPTSWTGEWIQNEDLVLVDSRPATQMTVTEAGVDIQDLRLYPRCLSPEEIEALLECKPAS